jgi:hypothetical protein
LTSFSAVVKDISTSGVLITAVANLGYLPQQSSSSQSSLICPIPGLTSLGKLFYSLVAPSVLLGITASVFVWESKKKGPSTDEPRDERPDGLGDQLPSRRRLARITVPTVELSHHAKLLKFARGVATAFLTSTSSLLSAAFDLMHCAPGRPGMEVLLKSGDVQCYQTWQYLIVVSIGALILSPVVLWVYVRASKTPFALGAMQVLATPFNSDYQYWSMMLLMQRSILIALDTFVTQPLFRAGFMMSWCLGMLLSHTLASPFESKAANALQTGLLSCLVVMSFLITPHSVVEQGGVQTPEELDRFLAGIAGLESALLLVPLPYICWDVWRKSVRARSRILPLFQSCWNCGTCGGGAHQHSGLEEPLLCDSTAKGGSGFGVEMLEPSGTQSQHLHDLGVSTDVDVDETSKDGDGHAY